jgi:hypothetical protein
MTLATKNGSLIVKDGKLAENCECCGGWYCCFSPACVADSITGVTVTITASDYLRWTRGQFESPTFGTLYDFLSVGFLGSAYAGTHALTKQPSGSTWTKSFATSPHSTCIADIEFLIQPETGWQLVFRYSALAYGSFTTEEYKELSQMVCRGTPDRAAGYPSSSGPQGSQFLRGDVGQCASLLDVSQTLTFQAVFPPLPVSTGSGSRVIVREEGNFMATIGLSVTQA